ncbi:MAG TPA: enolase C-terminal domain-like protein, partial [Polyangiaceae bacterium]|nr:enolase C-terminal domain-like protein [Polyangiaceae bacterium]
MKNSTLSLISHRPRQSLARAGRFSLDGRESWLMRWTIEGRLYEGEASPLSGFGPDSPDLCRQEITSLDAQDLVRLSEGAHAASDPLAHLLREGPDFRSPAARFAFETCILNRVADLRQQALWQLLKGLAGHTDPTPSRMPTSAVIEPLVPDWFSWADSLFARGIRTFKVKVGRDLLRELRALRELSARYGPSLSLRIDPNQSWTSDEILELSREALESNLEWLEDPSSEADGWQALASPIPLAADEILLGEEPNAGFLELLNARFVVLKPMALGGFSACLDWARIAQRGGRPVSVSHLF